MTIQETYEEIITILESILEEYESDPIKKTKRYQNNLKKNTDYINKVKEGGQQVLVSQEDIENSALGATKTTNASQARKSNFTKEFNKRHANDEKPKEPEMTQMSLFCSLANIVESYLELFEEEGIMHYVKKHGGNKAEAFKEYIEDRNAGIIKAAQEKTETEKKAKTLFKKRMKGDIDLSSTIGKQERAYKEKSKALKNLLDQSSKNHTRNLKVPSLEDKLITATYDPATKKEGLQKGSINTEEIKNIRRQ